MGLTIINRLVQIKQLRGCHHTSFISVHSLNVFDAVISISDYPTNSSHVTSYFIEYIYKVEIQNELQSMSVLNLCLTCDGFGFQLNEGVWLLRGLTNCFIHMQTGLKRLWSLQQADTVSPWWMTQNIASCREPVLHPPLDSNIDFCSVHQICFTGTCTEMTAFIVGITFLFLFIVSPALRCWHWGERVDKWSYTHDNSPQGFFCSQHNKYQEAVAVIDSLMTELCKSFNPFIKLNRGALDALFPSTSAHLAPVNDTRCCQELWGPRQEPVTTLLMIWGFLSKTRRIYVAFGQRQIFSHLHAHMLSISFNPIFWFTTNKRFLSSPRTRAGRLEFLCAVSGCRLLESLEFYGHVDWSAVCGLWPSVLVSGCDLWMVSTASLSSSRRWRSDLFSPFSWYRRSI